MVLVICIALTMEHGVQCPQCVDVEVIEWPIATTCKDVCS